MGQYGSTQAAAQEDPEDFVVPQQPVKPRYEVDPFWPQPLPNDWVLGQVAGVDVDQHDNIWIVQRPGSLTDADLRGNSEAPPVMAFDPDGNLLQAFGPGADDPRDWDGCEWPVNEHGLWVDGSDNVWIAGNGDDDHQVLKLSTTGDCLLQIGRAGQTGGSNDPELLGRPADGDVDDEANEVYVADGYENRRVVVFDADTGEYKRHWGAYGTTPVDDDAPAGLGFGNPVHCAVLSNDGLVYVCDRPTNRVQVFEKDGTFVEEFFIAPDTGGNGSVWDLDFTPDPPQTFLLDADGENQRVHILRRDDPAPGPIGEFGRGGRYAGQFHWVHNLVTDSNGDLYTAEVDEGKRLQKFDWTGFEPVDERPRGP